jgi:hypothetical protein
VTPHADARLVTVSVWRDDRCVASVHLTPDEAAALTGKLTGALAELAAVPAAAPDPAPDLATRVADLEARLAALQRPATA